VGANNDIRKATQRRLGEGSKEAERTPIDQDVCDGSLARLSSASALHSPLDCLGGESELTGRTANPGR
jgi:hypothetical protein